MKKALVSAILGLAAVVSTYGQGHILVGNYFIAPYNPVAFDASGGGGGVSTTAVKLQFFYALGTVADPNQLTSAATGIFTVNPSVVLAGGGPGYFDLQDLSFPDWSSGSVTVQIRASGIAPGGTYAGASSLWQIPAGVAGSGNGIVGSAIPANTAAFFPGLTVSVVAVPEPTTFALAGLGSAAFLIFRRRKA